LLKLDVGANFQLTSLAKSSAYALIPLIMFGVVFGIGYYGIPRSLNYSAYQITGSSSAQITLLYSFPLTSGVGTLDMSPSLMANFRNASGDCGVANCTGVGIACGVGVVDCSAISVTPSIPEISYHPSFKTVVSFRIEIAPNASLPSEYFILFPPAWHCRYALFLIFGSQIPAHAPVLVFDCPAMGAYPNPKISVVGIQNMTGLNLPS
jgi:hypothetical protein